MLASSSSKSKISSVSRITTQPRAGLDLGFRLRRYITDPNTDVGACLGAVATQIAKTVKDTAGLTASMSAHDLHLNLEKWIREQKGGSQECLGKPLGHCATNFGIGRRLPEVRPWIEAVYH